MAQFFKFLFASCLGVILATFVLFGIGSIIMIGLASSVEKPIDIKANSVLRITLNNPVPEKTNNLETDPFDLQNQKILGLAEILGTLKNAKEDDNIKGIFLEVDGISSGFATAASIREALEDFKESGKFIFAYSKYYSQGAYYLASAADEVYAHPLGAIDFRGFAAQVPFFKEMLDKVGIKMQIFYAGKFKSATEPYRRNEMSDESRMQTREYINEMYQLFLHDIGQSRNLSIAELKHIANEYLAADPADALKTGLVDKVSYRDEVIQSIRDRLGLDEEDKLPLVSLKEYNRSKPVSTNYKSRDKIAVIYAEGTIIDGAGANGSIGDDRYRKIIEKIRKDDRIKAVVLRVNSPGGSAMSSENIWRELSLLKEANIPLIVSMGDYAASGGYYIACLADSILAEPITLTGSIGVFNIIPSAQKLLNEKIGIRFDSVKTGRFSTGLTPFYDLSPAEGQLIQKQTNRMYETFLQRVADGRNMTRDEVHKIAQGRVWTGVKAKELGLVDGIGDLEQAVEMAANMAELEDYRLVAYPKIKEPLQEFLENITGQEDIRSRLMIRSELKELYPHYKLIKEFKDNKGVFARLPFVIPFN